MDPLYITLLFAFTGGILPALIWLFFWLSEDEEHPEPASKILLCFVFGMISVFIAFGLEFLVEKYVLKHYPIDLIIENNFSCGVTALILIVFIEEFLKFGAAWLGGLRTKYNDEAVDVMVYIITAALGFAAMENSLFVLSEFAEAGTSGAIILGNFRFVGSTLLHVTSSGLLGLFLAFSMFKKKLIRIESAIVGLILAIILHAIYNLTIIIYSEQIIKVFGIVWLFIIALIFIFEKVKAVHLNKIEFKTK